MTGSLHRRKAKTLHIDKILSLQHSLTVKAKACEDRKVAETKKLAETPSEFFEEILGFKPYKYQLRLIELSEKNQFVAARWCKESESWHSIPSYGISVMNPSFNHDLFIRCYSKNVS